MSLSELTPRPNRMHFFAAFLPLAVVGLLAILIFWGKPESVEFLPLLGLLAYLLSFLYCCKRFGMTKNDVVWLSLLTALIVFAVIALFLCVFLLLVGTLAGSSFPMLLFLCLGVLIATIIGLAVHAVIYAIIIYIILAMAFPSKKKRKAKK